MGTYVDCSPMKFFVYHPTHPDARQDGIIEYDILCATTRLTGKDKGLVRFIIDKKGSNWHIDDTVKQYVESMGFLRKIENAFAAPEGTEFRGWNRTRQYRLTKEEIMKFIVEKEEECEGKVKVSYRVFTLCGVAMSLPSHVSGNKQNRGYLPGI